MSIAVKICGLTRVEDAVAAVAAGVTFVGVVFFRLSPRFLTPPQATAILDQLPDNVGRVGLFADPDDTWLDEVVNHVRLDMIQLHGRESVERVKTVRQTFGLPVMKAIALQTAEDLAAVSGYLQVVDWLLFDSRPPASAARPGGHGIAFDWNLLQLLQIQTQAQWSVPWMLAGGLTPINVAEAIRRTGATAVDVSSGVEERPGVKSIAKIHAFLESVRQVVADGR